MKALSTIIVLLFAIAAVAAETEPGENSTSAHSWANRMLSRTHLGLSSGATWLRADNDIGNAFVDAGFGGSEYSSGLFGIGSGWANYPAAYRSGVPLNVSGDYDLTPRLRLGLYYRSPQRLWVDGRNLESESVEQYSFGARASWVVLPLKAKRGPELAMAVGVERISAKLGSYIGWLNEETYGRWDKCPFCTSVSKSVAAANLLASCDYYFARWLSVQASFMAVIAPALDVPQQDFISVANGQPTVTKSLPAHQVSLSGQMLSLGFRIHG